MRIVQLTTDGRELLRDYASRTPILGTAPQALLEGFAELAEVEVHVVSCLQHPVSSPEKLFENVWFHPLHVPKIGWLRTGYQGCVRAVRNKLRQLRPDLVHGQGTERECAWCAVWSGFPNVLTLHGVMTEMARMFQARAGSFAWCAGILERQSLKRTRGVLCNSNFTRSLVQRHAPNTWLVPNAVRAEFFSAVRAHRTTPKPVLLNIGVICENKRQLEILELSDRWRASGLSFELRFVGQASPSDPYASRFLAAVGADSRKSYVSFHGLKLGRELIDCYDTADALIHFPKVESFGLVAAEALCRGVKVFAARTGGLSDILDGLEGTDLFASQDFHGLETSVARWLKEGAPRAADTVRSVMRERYHPSAIARRHLEIYRDVLAKRS
jgi:glycosyltransferase involved in cell wall biosynthesis